MFSWSGGKDMRKFFTTAFVLVAMLVFATSSFALEKTAARMTDDGRGDWTAGNSCSVVYYNYCTGWVWVWSGWGPGECLGVCFDSCCNNAGTLDVNWMYVWTGAPTGYGFTGTISVSDADNKCCPTQAIFATQVYLPVSGWNLYVWGIPVGAGFVIQACHGVSAFPNPTAYATDHPAAGPTGPVACGTCYPTTRVNHSYQYGPATTPLCPGATFNDGICDAQLMWDIAMSNCGGPISIEDESWSKIKALYR